MPTTPKLTIGPVTYKAGSYGSFAWPQTLGLEAPRVLVRLAPEDAAALLAGPREVTITMQDATGKTKTISRVYVVGEEHSPDKLIRTVILSDVRFYLPFGWVRASFNLVVGTGSFRQLQNDAKAAQAPTPTVQNYQYVGSSLKDGAPWSFGEIARKILELAVENHDFPTIVVNDKSRPRRSSITPNNVRVDAPGDVAIGQTLGALGGLDIRVEDDGSISIIDAYLGAEKETLDPIVSAYSLETKGVIRWISMGPVCPAAARVLVTRRLEVRADSWEAEPGPGGNLSLEGDDVTWGTDNTPTMINVAKVTDQMLPPGSNNPFIQGTLVPFSIFLESIAAANDAPAGAFSGWIPITRYKLTGGVGGRGSASLLMSGDFERQFVSDHGTGVGSDVVWAGRVGEIQSSFRTLYKLNPRFANQCLPGSIEAVRVGLLDSITGKRQPATVYMDFIQRPTDPGFSDSDKFGWGVNNVPGTPDGDIFPTGIKTYTEGGGAYNVKPFPITSAKPAPFQVQVQDKTLGVFYFTPNAQDTSKIRHAAQNLPGLLWRFPVSDGGKLRKGQGVAMWGSAQRLLTHRIALIFSAIPVGGSRALQSYTVSIEEALGILGAPSSSVNPRAPTRELRIREGVALALIPWQDGDEARTARLNCFNAASTATLAAGVGDGLIPVNDVQLREFAVATFANWVACLLDHYEGTAQVGYMPGVMPLGSLKQVQHVFEEGGCYTILRCDGVTPSASPEDMLSQSSRNILFGGLGIAS